jgi:hypothetical protein
MGSGPACYLAAKYNPKLLILMSAYRSIKAVADNMVSKAVSWVVKERFENIEKI